MKNMKKFASLGLSLVMMLSLAACGGSKTPAASGSAAPAGSADGSAAAAESDLEYVKNKGKLVVGITDFAPMDYKDKDGKWIGFDADNATAFAKSLGVDVEFIEVDWDNKIMELDSKSIDCVWNGMTLTDEVKNSMETSKPYCENAQVVVVKAADADKYKDTDSLKELMAGAMIGEGTSYTDLTYTVKLNSEEYGVGFRKGSDLAAALNDFFAASYKDGSLKKTAETYGVQESLIAQ